MSKHQFVKKNKKVKITDTKKKNAKNLASTQGLRTIRLKREQEREM